MYAAEFRHARLTFEVAGFWRRNLVLRTMLDPGTISYLSVRENQSLSSCAVKSVCAILSDPDGVYGVMDNAGGCNGKDEVLESCIDAVPEGSLLADIVFYPNPANISFRIDNNSFEINHLCIYNQYGHRVYSQSSPSGVIDVSSFESGMYLVEIASGKDVVRKKLFVR